MAAEKKSAFPINDKVELPFIGVVRCHSRHEEISFEANGRTKKWPFKMYYLPNGMFVRAEFVKPGSKNPELNTKKLGQLYRSAGQSILGFPDKSAPGSIGKVLQSLYEHEAFDKATGINISWVVLKFEHVSRPYFVANIFGVSPGLMGTRFSSDDEAFKRYRILLTPEGEAVYTDNLL